MKVKKKKNNGQKIFGIALVGIAVFACGFSSAAHAATSVVTFDPNAGTLSVTGSCSGRYVLVIIRDASGTVWGSSNPPCVNGAYSYSIAVPDSDRTGATFSVSAADNGVSASAVGAPNHVVFAPAMDQTATSSINSLSIALDTSSLAAAPDDASFLDGLLRGFFGMVTDAANVIETSVVAAMQLFVKAFTIIPGGSISVPTGPNEIAGQGMLAADATNVFIANTSVTTSSDIIVTPTSPTQVPLAVTQVADGSGFYVGTVSPQAAGVSFTWIIVNTYADSTSSVVTAPQVAQPSQSQSLVVAPPPVLQAESSTVPAPDDAASNDDASTTDASTTTTDDMIASTTDTTVAATSTDVVATDTPAALPTSIVSADTATTSTDATAITTDIASGTVSTQ